MKRSKLILGGIGVAAILTTTLVVSNNLEKKKGAQYTQDRGSLATVAGANGFREWVNSTMIDVETGEVIEAKKLNSIVRDYKKYQTKAITVNWSEHGPDNIGGRTRAIHVDHTSENIIWSGGVSGGLFKSTNGANYWSRVANFPGGQFISSIAQDAAGNVYVATGSNDEAWGGEGLFVTPDGGETWQIVPGTASYTRINRVAATKHSPIVYFTHSSGLKEYTFGGTVKDVSSYGGTSGAKTLAYAMDGKAIVVASGSNETWFSTDWGQTFEKVSASNPSSGLITQSGFGRIEYAISTKKSDGTYSIYAATSSSNNQGQWITLDNGASWHKHTAATSADNNNGVIDYRNQGTYNSVVSFDPTDVNRVIVGGIDLHEWKKQIDNPPAGGWSKLSLWFASPTSPLYVHADNHELKWDSNNKLYIGNDGGIGISLDRASTFYPANKGYNITQFYAIGHDRNGSVIGGTQDNGSLYNNHQNGSYQEFKQLSGGDGFTAEISFFNPDVIFTSVYYNSFYRSGDGGATMNAFVPKLVGYQAVGGLGSTDHPFHTQFHLAEYYDVNSEDSVVYIPRESYNVGDVVRVPSRATGDTIDYITPDPIQFDDTLYYNPILTTTEYTVVDGPSQNVYDLGLYSFTPFPSASGNTPPEVGDTILVDVPNGPDVVVVQSVSPYNFYYGSNSVRPGTIPFGRDTMRLGVAWDTLTVQDPFQSWFVFSTSKNGGEVWGTRDATRLSTSNPQWVRLMEGIGNAGQLDVAFSKDLNHMYVTANSNLYRLTGLGSVYTSDPNFKSKLHLDDGASATTKVTVGTGGFSGVGVNPNNPDDVVAVQQFSGNVYRSSNATSATPSLTSVGSQGGVGFYDVIIDRDDSDILFAATYLGVAMSENGGATWTDVSDDLFKGVPSYRIRQAWRSWDEGNKVPGEVFVGTYGRGIWSTDAVLNVSTNDPLEAKAKKKSFSLEVYPNPSRYNTTLIVDMKESNSLDIQFYNISGRLVKRIRKTDAHVGRNEVEFNASDLPQGTYLIRVQSGSQIENTKFVKM
ncbi:MAG TPA: T9SS type A sorting domain-containing protein [Brumimicrobium sp.]|nr:T9SS type A sorting domain-containing protein [Brumimicrobium sp.]